VVGVFWKKLLTKLCKNCSFHLKFVLALLWEIWSERLSRQHSTYMYILMNHWIATSTTGSYCLKNRQTCRSHHLCIVCSQCLPPTRTQACGCWPSVANHTFNEQCHSDCALALDAPYQFVYIWYLGTRCRRIFRAYSINMTLLTTRLMIFENITVSRVCFCSMIH